MTVEQAGDASTDTRMLTVLEHPIGLSPYYYGDAPLYWETALFLTYGSNTKRLQMRQAQRLVASVTKRATAAGELPDGKRLSPHALRHSYALRVLLGGAHVPALSRLLGHTNLNTTMRYTNHFERRDLARYASEVTTIGSSSGAAAEAAEQLADN